MCVHSDLLVRIAAVGEQGEHLQPHLGEQPAAKDKQITIPFVGGKEAQYLPSTLELLTAEQSWVITKAETAF